MKYFIKLLSISIFFVFGLKAIAQEKQSVSSIVKYNFTHVLDTNRLSNPHIEVMALYIGKTASWYHSYDKLLQDSVNRASSTVGRVISPVGKKNVSETSFYLYPTSHKLFRRDYLLKHYVYPIEYPSIKWQLNDEFKDIAGLRCQSATGFWKGRTYTAWFTKEIPVSFGPWKLNGLPGLILEAYDSKKQIKFEFAGMQNNKDATKLIEFPKDMLLVTEKEYKRLYDSFRNDPIGFMSATTGVKLTGPPPNIVRKPSNSLNNPMELD